jgi:7,8-dihydropterin-6-yl-methyl-4-(beta-D-ribofuranosyl)aminobenzene 5'-phosphate synthase
MKRREMIAGAIAVPLLAGCASQKTAPRAAVAKPPRSQITVLTDAFGREPTMTKDWGYAALVEAGGKRILFDTGNNGDVLAKNAKAKGADLSQLDFVVMSHRHGDHMGGLSYLLSVNPKVKIYAPVDGFGVYGFELPAAFPRVDESLPPYERYFDGKREGKWKMGSAWPGADFQLIDKTTQVAPGITLIALVSDKPGTLELRELSLAIDTPDGIVLVVGCSHPGIDNIAKAVAAINPKIHFIAGGFHLLVAKDPEIESTVATLRNTYKVEYIAPGHCTGEPTLTALKRAFGDRYLYAGLGSTLTLGATPRAVGASGESAASALDDAELQGYRALAALAGERRRRLFAGLQQTTAGGAYLAQSRRSLIGCC